MIPQHIIDAVVDNANRHYPDHGWPLSVWLTEFDQRYLCALIEEVGEASAAARGKHGDPIELEIMQIAGICLNWLSARGTSCEAMQAASLIERERHG